jgi:hypothetical protein
MSTRTTTEETTAAAGTAPAARSPEGDPTALGLPCFIAGSASFGLAQAAKELYLVVWLIVIVTLTLTTLRAPLVYTAVFVLVDLALLLAFLGVNEGSAGMSKAAGYVALAFAALGVYLYAATAAVATGGSALPLGRPLLGVQPRQEPA